MAFGTSSSWRFRQRGGKANWIIDKQRGGITPISKFHLKFILLVFLFKTAGILPLLKLDVFVRIVSPFEAAKCKANQMEEPSTQHSLQTHYVTFKSKYITFSRWKKRYPSTNSSCNQASPWMRNQTICLVFWFRGLLDFQTIHPKSSSLKQSKTWFIQ